MEQFLINKLTVMPVPFQIQAQALIMEVFMMESGYHVLPISILLIAGYLFTHYLFTKGILDRKKHRRIWNILLTTGYMGMGSTGVILIFLVNLGIRTALNPTITFWHVEFAVLMTITTLIHIHLNWKPFKNIFKVLFKQYII